MRLTEGNYSAQYGHTSGGTVEYTSKSGTKDLHGVLYEYFANDALNARGFFNGTSSPPKQRSNTFGFAVGGPVIIPKIYNGRNKTFFFFSLEGFRNRNGASNVTATVPTAEMYDGNFSKWVDSKGNLIPIYDPTTQVTNADGTVTRTIFNGNQVPKSFFNTSSVQALGVFQKSGVLTPNSPTAIPGTAAYVNNNYIIGNGTNVQPVDKRSIKGDHVFGEKHRISGYYGFDRESVTPGPDGPPTLPGLYSNYNDTQQAHQVEPLLCGRK